MAELMRMKKQGDKPERTAMKPWTVSPMLPVPDNITKPDWYASGRMPDMTQKPEVHNEKGIEGMRASCRLASDTLQAAGKLCKPGVTTAEIDELVHQMAIDAGAYPSPLNYGKFPKSVCTSVNEVMCHGIPDARPLQEGDVINVDVTVLLNGYHGDTSAMFQVGKVSSEAKKLCEVAKLARDEAIKACGPGVPFNRIGGIINDIADEHKMGLSRDFIGHGVGTVFHAAPMVLHHRNREPGKMVVGQTFTIEPILTLGRPKFVMWRDDWTAAAKDKSLSAQWEHTILITPNGHEVLTEWR